MASVEWHKVIEGIDYSPPPMTYCDDCGYTAKDSPYWCEAGCDCK